MCSINVIELSLIEDYLNDMVSPETNHVVRLSKIILDEFSKQLKDKNHEAALPIRSLELETFLKKIPQTKDNVYSIRLLKWAIRDTQLRREIKWEH